MTNWSSNLTKFLDSKSRGAKPSAELLRSSASDGWFAACYPSLPVRHSRKRSSGLIAAGRAAPDTKSGCFLSCSMQFMACAKIWSGVHAFQLQTLSPSVLPPASSVSIARTNRAKASGAFAGTWLVLSKTLAPASPLVLSAARIAVEKPPWRSTCWVEVVNTEPCQAVRRLDGVSWWCVCVWIHREQTLQLFSVLQSPNSVHQGLEYLILPLARHECNCNIFSTTALEMWSDAAS